MVDTDTTQREKSPKKQSVEVYF